MSGSQSGYREAEKFPPVEVVNRKLTRLDPNIGEKSLVLLKYAFAEPGGFNKRASLTNSDAQVGIFVEPGRTRKLQ
jgi:hypothetical protein